MTNKADTTVTLTGWRADHDKDDPIYQAAERFAAEILGTEGRLEALEVASFFSPAGIPIGYQVNISTNDREYAEKFGIDGRGDPRKQKPGAGRVQKPT